MGCCVAHGYRTSEDQVLTVRMIVNKIVTAPIWPSAPVTLPKNSCALVTVPPRLRHTGLLATGLWVAILSGSDDLVQHLTRNRVFIDLHQPRWRVSGTDLVE